MSSPEETMASGRPKRRAAQPPPIGPDIEGRDAATGSCHCCGGMLRRHPESAKQCGKCGARYHTYDCGNRRGEAGFTNFDQCPRCAEVCMCTGGPVVCHTRALRDSRRVKRQNSSTALPMGGGEEDLDSATPTDERTSAEDSATIQHRDSATNLRIDDPDAAGDVDGLDNDDSMVDDPAAPGGSGQTRHHREWLPAGLRAENEALRAENEQLRRRLAMGGSTSVPVSMMLEPRPVDAMMHDGERRVNSPTVGAVKVFFPEEEPEPEPDREPFNCFNASRTMYIGDAWSAEIVQAYRERVALQGGSDAGPLTEQADKRKIFWRNVLFSVRMVVLLSFLFWSIAWHIESAALHGAEWHYSLFAVLYVFVTVWAYQGYRNLLACGRMVVADRRRKRQNAGVAAASGRV